MNTEPGFLDAIRAEPDELDHRLIYADWLEEHSEAAPDTARAELIRAQIGRELLDVDELEFWKLRARERIVLQVWAEELAGPVWSFAEDCRFRRGFVEAVALPVETLHDRGQEMLETAPIQGVALAGETELVTPEMLAPFAGLRIWSVLGRVENAEQQRELAEGITPRLLDVGPQWMSLLRAGLPRWSLRHLGLGTVRIPESRGMEGMLSFGEEEIEGLLACAFPETLRSLDLRGVHLDAAQWEQLLAHPVFERIERMALWAAPAHGNALEFLAGQRGLGQLRSLWLGGSPGPRVTNFGESLRGLRELVLQGDDWFQAGMWERPSGLSFPEVLLLRQEYVREMRALVDWLCVPEAWPSLRVLEFRRWQANYAELVPRLLESPVLPQLRRLEIAALPETGFTEVWGPLALAELTLSATDLSSAIAAVSYSRVLPNLVSLEIARARLDRVEDLEPLLDRQRFPHLLRIEVGGLELEPEWEERFARRFGEGARFRRAPCTVFPVHDRILEARL